MNMNIYFMFTSFKNYIYLNVCHNKQQIIDFNLVFKEHINYHKK